MTVSTRNRKEAPQISNLSKELIDREINYLDKDNRGQGRFWKICGVVFITFLYTIAIISIIVAVLHEFDRL